MKKNLILLLVLAGLAIVPITISFLCSDDDADSPAPPPRTATRPESRTGQAAAKTPKAAVALADSAKVPATEVPVFKGFEDARYQQYDAQIRQFCEEFNKSRKVWAGSTADQAAGIPALTPAQVKAHMIQETGGGDLRSRTAWKHDPLQVNVPGDWNPYKKYLGLTKPRRCNEGSGTKNLKAGLMLLSRKGFGVSGQPAGNRPDGRFDGWPRALQRYNGRSDKTTTGTTYSEAYSARIRQRAEHPGEEVPIPIPTKRSKKKK